MIDYFWSKISAVELLVVEIIQINANSVPSIERFQEFKQWLLKKFNTLLAFIIFLA